MGFLADKVHRAMEAAYLVTAHAADLQSSAALLSCYAALLRGPTDLTEIAVELRMNRVRYPFRLRKCDIFTLSEILYHRQYRLRSPLPKQPLIIDAGANIGVAAAWFLANYPGAMVHCFEPQSDNFRLLKANLGARTDVVLERAALGSSTGEAQLHLAAHDAEHSVIPGSACSATETVPLLRLADHLRKHAIQRIDLLKLDVEGSELNALLGLGDFLESVQVIVGEVHERLVDQNRFYALLARAGFDVLYKQYPPKAKEEGVHHFEAVRDLARIPASDVSGQVVEASLRLPQAVSAGQEYQGGRALGGGIEKEGYA